MNKESQILIKAKEVEAPKAAEKPKVLSMHGHDRVDPYYWMNERENPEVLSYLEAENEYTEALLKHTRQLQDELFTEITSRIPGKEASAPYFKNGFYYYYRYEDGKEYPIYCRKKDLEGTEEIMIDVNELAEGHDYYQIGGLSVSPDNRSLIFGEDTVSRRQYTLRHLDLENGEITDLGIKNTTGSVAWANDSKTFFYTLKDESLRPCRILRHTLGLDPNDDVLVYEETDETFITYAHRSTSGSFIFISSFQTVSTEYRVIPADDPDARSELFEKRERNHEYFIDHIDNYFYIKTNWNALNFRIMRTALQETSRENWQEWLPHRADVLIEGIDLFRDHIVVSERSEGLPRIVIHPKDGEPYLIPFEEQAYVAFTAQNFDQSSPVVRLIYSSLTTPVSTYEFDTRTSAFRLLKRQEVVGGYDPSDYQTERLHIPARDGKTVPVSLVLKKDTPIGPETPLYLYAYGSYGHSIDPSFSYARLSLLDRGFVFAIAHIRGGEELGRSWYEEGKLFAKKNTFNDFIDVAKYLIQEKYTSSDHLFAMGGSAGGLLMGAVVNESPDLWKGVIAAVPFVDVVTTMLDDTIPLTTGEYDEWGNPNEKAYYEYMLSYSPYDNVGPKDYPAMLVTTGLHDSQVQYWEPAKWVSKIRKEKTGDAPVLLFMNLKTGHSGASGRFERYKETAMEYAFLLDLAEKI